jgi:hypothetical protein
MTRFRSVGSTHDRIAEGDAVEPILIGLWEQKPVRKYPIAIAIVVALTIPASAQSNVQQQRMKDCNTQASGMTGDTRKQFMSSCLSGSAGVDRERFDMSEDTAICALRIALAAPAPTIKIEFQGGEPLLNFPL